MTMQEPDAVKARYGRRDAATDEARYSLYGNAAALQAQQERLRAMVHTWAGHGWHSLGHRRMLEVGCGSGGNLQDLLRLGATPGCLTGIELLPARAALARSLLPQDVTLLEEDAVHANVSPASQDAVLAFTLFSSLLDMAFRRQMAQTVWGWVAPGGGVLVYDFVVDNPRNPDVRRVPLQELQDLFPNAHLQSYRLTLAPPIARRLPAWMIAPASQLLRPLRTHRLTWVVKP
ncbi:bifunctional 2-polyprenyl-6-hydroxyphenol methylase/3-demethylubiquinol 3-O-methyltransferase UbiG [Acidovorax sp. sic0104]|jgi:SAM-dependent methyltransferase|uniref:class I SAM-dependent methyltransferase n=1 Tax=Acidovorax sp. sic0104 TaxID=2854784 RepID=UPI001C495D9D|nr:class I SAM-dependent methyltransferase [Acidovorax sp. sic0104]MBV7539618.1 class I SAM-dependent methyltransferase [Acidovorax sp. sic0104]